MSTLAMQRNALLPRSRDGTGSGFVLALLAHGLLVVALAFGVNWKASEPEGVEAELWAAVPQIAAPKAVEPDPTPMKIEPKPEPVPVVKPEPVPVPKQQTLPDAQIAIEKAKREDLRKKKEEAEKLAQLEKLEKQKLEKEDKRKKEQEAVRAAAEHDKAVKRMLAQAGAGDATSTGRSAQTAGPSASYLGRIKARIKPNVIFTGAGNPTVEVEITVAPDGTILSSRVIKPSGVQEWDNAVVRGIEKTAVLPRDTDGRIYSPMVIVYQLQGN